MQSLTQRLSQISFADPLVWLTIAGVLVIIFYFLLLGRKRPRNPEIVLTTTETKPPEASVPPPAPRHDERRKSIRRTGMPTPVFVLDFKSARLTKPANGYVLDRSSGGLRLAVENPYPVGTTLKVRPSYAPPEFDWINVVIRSCRESSDYFEVGCQFESILALNQLLMFG